MGNEYEDKPQIMSIQKHNTQNTAWKKVEAVVDSGAIDAVANPKDFPEVEWQATYP